jgi:LysR family glycine cleavage system transcriptional activator
LPSLNSLRAFEAAGRHLSLTKAAEELLVTPAAVSHQVKSLEQYLEVQLLRRVNNVLLLTDAGQLILPGLKSGLDCFVGALDLLNTAPLARILTVHAPPSFSSQWLAPRLPKFSDTHPDIDLNLQASLQQADLTRDDVICPVCSPALCQGPKALKDPAQLANHTLIHLEYTTGVQTRWPSWQDWLDAIGVQRCDGSRGMRFSNASMAIQAAIDGHGVALVGRLIVADDLITGRLVRPFDILYPVNLCYCMVNLSWAAELPKVVAFRKWLKSELQETLEHFPAS